ncbi:hypothetical protein [Pseudoalteromonas denitrificans]|uniref:Uncharacterized protein n=1 Tax=Pseudoalteromonas denitrificans DSM 6059 TaxID=1123010 RepID=A0A1I1S9Z1_9GAMM|nr:hypothetical protein [Pseudoalteromonas denitrificans]SFD41448.1 hypothetical protein SAMN02745724_04458 [Pseudoalteromonas denitrificans DSM 6059]
MENSTRTSRIQPDWWSKSIAGIFLGLLLSVGLVGIFAWSGPGGIAAPVKVQFNMWLISPIWLLILSFTYMFKTGLRAFICLSSANIVIYLILFAVRA